MDYQITLFCNTGKYKPVSTIVKRANEVNIADVAVKKQLIADGAQKICFQRGWNSTDLKRNGYVTGKVRIYDKEKLEREAKERYERIKEEKYASGEWKRPKKKDDTPK